MLWRGMINACSRKRSNVCSVSLNHWRINIKVLSYWLLHSTPASAEQSSRNSTWSEASNYWTKNMLKFPALSEQFASCGIRIYAHKARFNCEEKSLTVYAH